jgi:hypothetical protein
MAVQAPERSPARFAAKTHASAFARDVLLASGQFGQDGKKGPLARPPFGFFFSGW